MNVLNFRAALEIIEDREKRNFRANVRNRFLQMNRVKNVKNLCTVEFLKDYAGTIDAYFPYEEDALMVLADDFEYLASLS
jgi:hypothetical protein